MTILDLMEADGLVPLRSSPDLEVLRATANAIAEAGLSTFEVTLRSEGAVEAISVLAGEVEDLRIGAGTVLTAADAEAVVDAGATFVLSPTVVPGVAAVCTDAGVPYIPGCATPTEIQAALELGCEVVKLFPASTLGPGFLSAVRAVFPGLRAIPTGGLRPEPTSLDPWFDAGAFAVGLGSALFPKDGPNRLVETAAIVARARARD
jgi:2-dehydro-3-deoxyphosphogluconate aldolase/(4S)-4-hydroxy-2-oxoglutarate aldolase